MKITINIDCTPEEARAFLGLPDVSALQETVMEEVEKRVRANLDALDPDTLLKAWFPAGMQGFEQLQRSFWSQMMDRAGGTGGGKDEEKDDT